MPAPSRSAQQQLVGLFDRVAAHYDRVGPAFFRDLAGDLVDRAAVPAGARMLDIGTGRGAVLEALARRHGAPRAVGVDLSMGMLAHTVRDLPAGATSRLARMDAARLGLAGGAFDAVFCAFALDLCPAPEAVLAEAHRVLAGGGRLAILTWAADCPYFRWLTAALDAALPGRRIRPAAPVAAATAAGLHGLLGGAGFADVEVASIERVVRYPDADRWWESLWTHCPRAVLERIEGGTLQRLEAAMRRQAGRRTDAGGIRADLRAHLALARRPGA